MALWLLLGLASASRCPSYSCASLATNVCAEYVSGQAFNVNTEGCQTGYCVAAAMDSWAQASGSVSSTLTCTLSPPSLPAAISACPTKLQGKNFLNGASVVTCASSSDCLLVDYTQQPCKCGFRQDGLGICEPHISNLDVFGDFWSACGVKNSISNGPIGLYWAVYIQLWVYIQGAVTCSSVFWELQELAKLSTQHATLIALLWLNAI